MTGQVRVARVRLDDVDFHPHNVRRDLGDLRPLAASIRRHGLLQPVVVEVHGERLRLRAGHRRVAAARQAGLARVVAVIHPEALDLDEWLTASVAENAQRQQLDTAERDRAIHQLRELGVTTEAIAETFGVTVSAVRKWTAPASTATQPRPRRPRLEGSSIHTVLNAWDGRDVDALLTNLRALADTGRLPQGVSARAG